MIDQAGSSPLNYYNLLIVEIKPVCENNLGCADDMMLIDFKTSTILAIKLIFSHIPGLIVQPWQESLELACRAAGELEGLSPSSIPST